MKYKDFKQMTIEDMKNVMGGNAPEGGGSGGCTTGCTHFNSSTLMTDSGTCDSGSVTVSGLTMTTCFCSVGGTCYSN